MTHYQLAQIWFKRHYALQDWTRYCQRHDLPPPTPEPEDAIARALKAIVDECDREMKQALLGDGEPTVTKLLGFK